MKRVIIEIICMVIIIAVILKFMIPVFLASQIQGKKTVVDEVHKRIKNNSEYLYELSQYGSGTIKKKWVL